MASLERALVIAVNAHQGQIDKAGQPYALHPLRMMLRLDDEAARITALLHDLIEDTDWTLEQLRAEGFAEPILAAVDRLTRRADESYEQFIERLRPDPLARRVKLADLEDNMDLRRITRLDEQSLARIERYHRAWRMLCNFDLP